MPIVATRDVGVSQAQREALRVIGGPSFKQQHASADILAEARGQYDAGRPAADHNHVMIRSQQPS